MTETARRRRPPGEARRLVLVAARDLFARKGYSDTSTREIADAAEVSEPLIFRYFGSKAELFREAFVVPFAGFVDSWVERHRAGELDQLDDRDVVVTYVQAVYELFRSNRGLLAIVWAADANEEHVLSESGVLDDASSALTALVDFCDDVMQERHPDVAHRQDLGGRAVLALTAGMAAFGESFYGPTRPADGDIVDEIAQLVMYGYLHPSHDTASPPVRRGARTPAPRQRAGRQPAPRQQTPRESSGRQRARQSTER